jgi:hypothetical protein
MLAGAEHAVQVARVVARTLRTTSSHRLEQSYPLAVLLGLIVLLPVFDQSAFAPERGSYLIEIRARRYWQLSRPRLELFDDARLGLWAMVAFGVRRWSLTTLTHDKLPRR